MYVRLYDYCCISLKGRRRSLVDLALCIWSMLWPPLDHVAAFVYCHIGHHGAVLGLRPQSTLHSHIVGCGVGLHDYMGTGSSSGNSVFFLSFLCWARVRIMILLHVSDFFHETVPHGLFEFTFSCHYAHSIHKPGWIPGSSCLRTLRCRSSRKGVNLGLSAFGTLFGCPDDATGETPGFHCSPVLVGVSCHRVTALAYSG